MIYRRLAFNDFPTLRTYVRYIYSISTTSSDGIYTTIPNGEIGLSFTLAGSASVRRNERLESIPQASAYGLLKTAQQIYLGKNLREITISFQPHIFRLFIPDGMHVFAGGTLVDLRDLFTSSKITSLHEQLYDAPDDYAILVRIENFLANQTRARPANILSAEAYRMIMEERWSSVDAVSNHLGISGTTLRTLFQDHIGLSPKELIKIRRVHEASNRSSASNESLTELSYRLGYADQAHFIREFKEMVGISPRKFFQAKISACELYNF